MSLFLGIDTSNYTTSVAVYNSENGEMLQRKQLLPVKQGQLGLDRAMRFFITHNSFTLLLRTSQRKLTCQVCLH